MDQRTPTLARAEAVRSKSGYRSDIDGLRTIAVLSVVAFHVGFPAFTGGFLGVDVFFVISGYLISKKIEDATERGDFTLLGFWASRYRRLFPALATTLLVSMAAAYFILPPEDLAQFGASAAAAAPGFSNFNFWNVSGYFDTKAFTKPALHTWSLGVEEQFYYIWPVILVPLLRRKGSRARLLAVTGIGMLSLMGSALFLRFGSNVSNDPTSAVFYLLPFRAYELALGGSILWMEWLRPRSRLWQEILAIAGLGAVVVSMFLFTEQSWLPALLPCAGSALLIFVGKGPLSTRLFDNPPSVWMGKISYSIYLVHWPIIVFSTYLFDTNGMISKLALCGASIALASALYYGIERPIHKDLSILPKKPQFFAAMLPAATLIVVIGVNAWASNGWLWRYESQIAGLLDPANMSLGLPPIPYRCFLSPTDSWMAIDKRCFVPTADGRPKIMMVGDSTAASLYPGLKAALGDAADLYLWSGSACVPALDVPMPYRPNCPMSNDQFFRHTINDNNYDLVIISAHGGYPELQKGFPAIKAILNARSIPFILLGDLPTYADIPLGIVARHGKITGLDDIMAANLADGCTEEHGLNQLVATSEFFSTKVAFCKVGRPAYRDGIHLFQKDWFHLTQAGALYLGRLLMPRIEILLLAKKELGPVR
ncbi:acyltransferase [Mesorhizobium sp. B2-4-15]|uniref:acyltransferase family protein n=1 Tax=Mesorhizobium sp. B2-4-15 TaxID=2589934 RepID=UPI001152E47F|nr:acyltransferase family protein [Mesorhizobium sp. B2-4-15]TPK76371.1 acyltransferase [Mesorhizobium sp. B2-4-15]